MTFVWIRPLVLGERPTTRNGNFLETVQRQGHFSAILRGIWALSLSSGAPARQVVGHPLQTYGLEGEAIPNRKILYPVPSLRPEECWEDPHHGEPTGTELRCRYKADSLREAAHRELSNFGWASPVHPEAECVMALRLLASERTACHGRCSVPRWRVD